LRVLSGANTQISDLFVEPQRFEQPQDWNLDCVVAYRNCQKLQCSPRELGLRVKGVSDWHLLQRRRG